MIFPRDRMHTIRLVNSEFEKQERQSAMAYLARNTDMLALGPGINNGGVGSGRVFYTGC